MYNKSDIKVDYGNGFILSNQQVDIIEAINIKKENVCIAAKSGASKAQPYSEPLLTPNGWTTMGEINVGDYVVGSNGKPTRVVEIHEHGVRPVYELTFIDDVKVRCDLDHLWKVNIGNGASARTDVLSLRELINYKGENNIRTRYKRKRLDKRYGTYQNSYFWSVPTPEPVDFNNDTNFIIPPFTLGVLISEGSLTRKSTVVQFTSGSQRVVDRVEKELPKDFLLSKKKYDGKDAFVCTIIHKENIGGNKNGCKYQRGNPYAKELVLLNLYGKKSPERFIPSKYKHMKLDDAKALYDGLTWTDGAYSSRANGDLYSYTTTSKQLMIDFVELSRQVGLVCKEPNENKAGYKKDDIYHECNTAYTVNIKTVRPKNDKSITNIKFKSKEKVRCITVEASDHMYITTGYTLTHNSSTMQMALKDVTNEMTNGLFIAFNNKIASEAKKDNPDWIETSTIHSLAYRNIVAPNGLKLRNRVDFKDFDNLGYRQRSEAVKCINKYCQSDVTKVSDFCSDISIAESVKSVMNKMLHGDLPITHDAYLKWFSLYLQLGIISPNKVDVVICDEYQDFSPCMASIFLLYPSKQKIGVGDNAQRVNGFMGSSDALQKLMINKDFRLMELTSTQRCSPAMAMVAQEFCRTYIESDFTYSGNNTCNPSYDSQMYITRTNSELIEIVPYLQSMNIKFNMTRKVDIIYHSYLMIQFNAEREYNYYKENQRNSDKFKKEDIRFVESYSKYRKDEAIRMMVRDKLISKDIAADRLSHSLRDSQESYFSPKLKTCSFAVWISMQDLLFEHQDMYMTAKSILMLVKNKVKIYDSYKYAKEIEKSRKKHSLIISTANSVKG